MSHSRALASTRNSALPGPIQLGHDHSSGELWYFQVCLHLQYSSPQVWQWQIYTILSFHKMMNLACHYSSVLNLHWSLNMVDIIMERLHWNIYIICSCNEDVLDLATGNVLHKCMHNHSLLCAKWNAFFSIIFSPILGIRNPVLYRIALASRCTMIILGIFGYLITV